MAAPTIHLGNTGCEAEPVVTACFDGCPVPRELFATFAANGSGTPNLDASLLGRPLRFVWTAADACRSAEWVWDGDGATACAVCTGTPTGQERTYPDVGSDCAHSSLFLVMACGVGTDSVRRFGLIATRTGAAVLGDSTGYDSANAILTLSACSPFHAEYENTAGAGPKGKVVVTE
jgi:hypothetical protein